jgi:regulator of nucleoside diphosphate kinase
MLTLPSVRLSNEDWVRLMSFAFDRENDCHPVSAFLRSEVHRAIVTAQPDEDVVRLNAWVTYRIDWEATESRILVHPHDYEPGGHYLSVLSRVGAALIGLRVGDRMPFLDSWHTPHLVTPIGVRQEPTTLGLLRHQLAG